MKASIKKYFIVAVSILAIFAANEARPQWEPTNGPNSGDIHSVIKSNGAILVGTKYIYKSSDDGDTWNISNNGISGSVNGIYSIVNTGSKLVAGTTTGVYYSTDNGDNWTLSSGTSSLSVFAIVIKGSNLFLSTVSNGIYKSTNGGTSWSACNTGITTITYMRALAVKGSDIYAATDGYGIYKSTNDGGNWSLVNNGLPGSYYSVSSLAVVGSNILAGTYGAGIYKSTNDGGSWSAVNNGVSATDDILAMGVNGTTIYASTLIGNLYQTTDYTNWNAVTPGNFTATRYEAFCSSGSEFYAGSWGFGSPEQAYGLFRTTDNGATWIQKGITDYPVSALNVSGSNILAGTYDVTGNSFRIPFFKTTETDTAWSFNLGGFAGKNITALKANGAIMYLFNYVGGGSSEVYRSTNNGNNWTSTGYNVLYNHFVSFAIAGSLVYAGDDQSGMVYVSSDNGQTWTNVNSGFPSGAYYVYALALKGTLLFAATNDGIYKNTVGQNNWTACSTGLTNMYVKSLIVSGNDIYAGTQGGGIFKSTNDGALWTDVSTGIPLYSNITCFETSGSNIIAGTDNGVFITANSGTNWSNVNTGLIDTSITVLTASTNYIWAGTTAHGVWRRLLSELVANVPSMPGPISGSVTVCHESNNTYSVSPVSGATSYTWTLPGGWSGSSTTNTIVATAGSSGIISVTANNSFGSSPAQTLSVTVNTPDVSVTQTGMTLTANATTATYQWINCSTLLPIGGATSQSYTATVPGNYAVIVTQNSCSDTSACLFADTTCNISISGSDLPYSGFTAVLSVDSLTSVTVGNSGPSQSWDYSNLSYQYQKYAEYHLTSSTPYASTFPASNIYTYGPGAFFGSLFGSAPVGSGNDGYVFWKSDNTGMWVTGFRPDGGTFAGKNVQVYPNELLIGAPATYGDVFNNSSRWELPMNFNPSDPDTVYARNVTKTITVDACGSITTPFALYPNVLREHEYVVTIDSIYYKNGSTVLYAIEFMRDTLNNYMYISNGVGYPVCIVHADKQNMVLNVEYYSGPYSGISENAEPQPNYRIFPNPSDGKMTIEIIGTENTISTVEIFNSIGTLVMKDNTMDTMINLDLGSCPKGIYFVRINTGSFEHTEKIIIQ